MSCLKKKVFAVYDLRHQPLTYLKNTREQSVENGIAKVTTSYKEFNFVTEDSHYDYRLFTISNLIAVGADKNLIQVKFEFEPLAVSERIGRLDLSKFKQNESVTTTVVE